VCSPFRSWILRNREMQNSSPFMRHHEKTQRIPKRIVGTVKLFTWFSKNILHHCDGDPLRRTRYLLTLVSLMSKPSLSKSPWIFGAPQGGFSRPMRQMSLRVNAMVRLR